MSELAILVLVALFLAAVAAVWSLFDKDRPVLNFAVIVIAVVLLLERVFGAK